MHKILPSIPALHFNVAVFEKIIEIYAAVAGIKNPCGRKIFPSQEIAAIKKEITEERMYCDFRFGSSLGMHSKLFLHPVNKQDCLHVGFDFDPNTADDAQSQAVAMREKFHEEVQRYLKTLTVS